ncbi:MAG TPA: ATP-grasp domain-containing protein [Candidatus Saccharimonadales bacterium]|nr:ATP-grasp domain-containing protein [Candidatus Saccharimonadales bacterium]
MKQILIVGGVLDDPVGSQIVHGYADGVQRVLGTDDYKVLFTRITNLQLVVSTGDIQIYDEGNNVHLRDMDLIALHGQIRHYRDMAYALSRFCAMHKKPSFNDFSGYYPGTKVGQAVVFAGRGVRIPKTVFCMDGQRFVRAVTKELDYPCIIKHSDGTQGKSNYLVHSEDEARDILKSEPHIAFIAQEYCPNDRDYRLLLTPSQQLVFERRGEAGTHLNNTSQGGSAKLTHDHIPVEIVAQSRAIAKDLGLTLAGVDLMPHLETGEFYFIEVNSQPQLFTGALLEAKEPLVKQLFLDVLEGCSTD